METWTAGQYCAVFLSAGIGLSILTVALATGVAAVIRAIREEKK